jgi:hypothetical protein
VDDLTSLIDALDKLVAEGPSSWFLRNRIRLNRKETRALVDRIGAALDAQTPSGPEQSDVAQTLLAEAFKSLAFEVRRGGGGGAAYRMRYLDTSRKRMSAMVESLRMANEVAVRAQTSSAQT